MLPTCERLRAQEVKEVLSRKSFSLTTSFFNARLKPSRREENEKAKFAIVCSTKISPLGVARHRIKRRASAALYNIRHDFPPNLHIVIFIKRDIQNIGFEEIIENFTQLLYLIKKG